LNVTLPEIESLATATLKVANVSEANAASVARSIAFAERDGQKIVGLSYLPYYCEHAACGKVDGNAVPVLTRPSAAAVTVDAATGFAHPAIDLGILPLTEAAKETGIAILTVGNSYACGSLGYFVEQLAERGLVAIMTANASPSIAPHGGRTPFFGTNPIAFAAPRASGAPLVIDQSSSVVAKVAVIEAHRRGEVLPVGWALDRDGNPTTSAEAAMDGSLTAIGGYKGVGLALMVDLLSAGLSGAHFSHEASSFGDCEGGPPRTGQCILAISPERLGIADFAARSESLLTALTHEPGTRVPGARRLTARQENAARIEVDRDIWMSLEAYAAGAQRAPA
ncbi:MAG: Ldh family oxidoreductase, partial [Shinella sp.]